MQEEFGEGAELIESDGDDMVGEFEEEFEMEDELVDMEEDDEMNDEAGISLDRMLHCLNPHNSESIYSIDVHPTDKTLLVTGGGDDWARLIRYEHMNEEYSVVAELGPNADSVITVKFSFDGKYVASGCMDGSVKIWDGITGQAVYVLEGPTEVVWIDWHPRGHVIAAGAEDGSVWMWNAGNKGLCMGTFMGSCIRSTTGCWSPDGKWLVTAGEGIVQVWNPKESKAAVTYDRAMGHPIPEGDIVSLAVNPASTLIAAGSIEGGLVLLSLTHQQVRNQLREHRDAVEGLAFHPRMNVLVSAGLDGKIIMWDLNTFSIRSTLATTEDEGIISLQWVSDPDSFVTTSVNGMISVWDGRSGVRLDQMRFRELPCLAAAPIPSKNLVFAAYENGQLCSFAYN